MHKNLGRLFLLWLAAVGAWAQAPYPSHPVTLVIPFAAGGDADQFGRALAHSVQMLPDAPTLILENRPGRSGTLASMAVRQANADGYTLLMGRVGTHAIQPALDAATPYRVQQFTTLAILELDPLICGVRADAPYASARDLLGAIRQQPGTFKYSTSGPGTILNFAAQYLMAIAGLPGTAATALHFEGGLEAVAALADGRVDFSCGAASSMGAFLTSGQLRGLFTTAAGRMEKFPQIPTAREAGYRGMTPMVGWTALMGPAELPSDVVHYWKAILEKVAADPVWIATTARLGGQPAIRLIAQPAQFVQEQYAFYRQLALSMRIQP